MARGLITAGTDAFNRAKGWLAQGGGGYRGAGKLPLGLSDIDVRLENTVGNPANIYVGNTALPAGSARDLASHYYLSQQIANKTNPVVSALAGGLWEGLNVLPRLWGNESAGGLSTDDLLANFAGYMGYSPEQAWKAGVFGHTEAPFEYGGVGQGLWRENLSKLKNLGLPEGSFPLVGAAKEKLENVGSSISNFVFTPAVAGGGDDEPSRPDENVAQNIQENISNVTRPTSARLPERQHTNVSYEGDPTGRKPKPFAFEDVKARASRPTTPAPSTTPVRRRSGGRPRTTTTRRGFIPPTRNYGGGHHGR